MIVSISSSHVENQTYLSFFCIHLDKMLTLIYTGKDFRVTIILRQQRFTRDLMYSTNLMFNQLTKAIEQAVFEQITSNCNFNDKL